MLTQAIGPSDYLLPEGRPIGGVLPSLTGIPVVGGGRGHCGSSSLNPGSLVYAVAFQGLFLGVRAQLGVAPSPTHVVWAALY